MSAVQLMSICTGEDTVALGDGVPIFTTPHAESKTAQSANSAIY
jgi:hypothetical protein